MADSNNTIKTTVELDANQAQQEIVKLNSKASDSTKTLEERIEAKNKAVKLQDDLSKRTIKNLENELSNLIKTGASVKDVERAQKKLNSEKLKSTKLSASSSKQQAKLSQSLDDSRDATKKFDDATGGLITKFKALVANPIGLVIIALAGAFKLVSEAIGRSEKASTAFAKVGAKLSGIFNGFIAIISPLAEFLGETLLDAIENPQKAFEELADTIKNNLINRLKSLLVLGDSIAELFKGNFKKASKLAADGFLQLASGIENATDKISNFGETAKDNYNKAAKASEDLANAERRLVKNRQDLEKQQLTSLKLAEEERQIRDDTSKDIEERIEANRRLGEVLKEQTKIELQLANQSLKIAKDQVLATGETIENLEAVGDAELKILEIRERITGQRSEQLVNETGLLKEQSDKLKEIALSDFEAQNNIDQLRIDAIKNRGENAIQEELKLLEKKREQELENTELTELGKQEIEERFKSEKAELENAEKQRKLEEDNLKKENLLELEELEIERLKEKGEATLQRELEFLEKRRLQDVSQADLTSEQVQIINEKAEIAKSKLRKVEEEATKEKNSKLLDSNISAAGEAFGINKELALAEAGIGLTKSVGDAWAANAKLGFPGNVLATGAQIAGQLPPIIKSISSLKNTKLSVGGKSVSGGGSSAATPSATGGAQAVVPDVVSNLASNNAARLGVDTNLGSNASSDASNNVVGGSQPNIVFSESKYNDFKTQVKFKEDKITI